MVRERVCGKVEDPEAVSVPAAQAPVWLPVSVVGGGAEHTALVDGGGGALGEPLGGVLVGGATGGGATMDVHNGCETQQVGAGALVQMKEHDWPGGVVPVAGAVGAAPQPGAAGGGGGATGGGAGGGATGGAAGGGLSGGRLTGGLTMASAPLAPA